MKAIQLLALVATGLLTLNNSCHQDATDEPCPAQEIAGTSVQAYPCIVDQSGQNAQLFVINSPQEFGAAFPCSSYRPRASLFRDSTLLVGWKNYANCGHVKSQRLLSTCTSYTYKVAIEAGVCQAALPVTSQLLVPKLPAGAKVVIDMQ